jgi:hypothetical protein
MVNYYYFDGLIIKTLVWLSNLYEIVRVLSKVSRECIVTKYWCIMKPGPVKLLKVMKLLNQLLPL